MTGLFQERFLPRGGGACPNIDCRWLPYRSSCRLAWAVADTGSGQVSEEGGSRGRDRSSRRSRRAREVPRQGERRHVASRHRLQPRGRHRGKDRQGPGEDRDQGPRGVPRRRLAGAGLRRRLQRARHGVRRSPPAWPTRMRTGHSHLMTTLYDPSGAVGAPPVSCQKTTAKESIKFAVQPAEGAREVQGQGVRRQAAGRTPTAPPSRRRRPRSARPRRRPSRRSATDARTRASPPCRSARPAPASTTTARPRRLRGQRTHRTADDRARRRRVRPERRRRRRAGQADHQHAPTASAGR